MLEPLLQTDWFAPAETVSGAMEKAEEAAEMVEGLLATTRILYPDPTVAKAGMLTETGLEEALPITVGLVKLPLALLSSTEYEFPALKVPEGVKPMEKL
jgi:hypothetical protein